MQKEAVERRGWLSRTEFLDLVGACNLLPGPGSTQTAMALGFRRAGWRGLLVAGLCFILPASLATLALAWIYQRCGELPAAQGLLYGARPVLVAILLQAVWNLGRSACRSLPQAALGAVCLAAALLGAPPLAILAGAGLLTTARHWKRQGQSTAAVFPLPFFRPVRSLFAATAGTAGAAGALSIFLVFLKMGVTVFGSGYVLLAFLQADLVDRLHWITPRQLLDAVTAGQLTPGPVFATATFLGYILHGWSGAALATAAIFLPSFPMAAAASAFAGRVRRSPRAAALMDGINVAAVALMAAVVVPLARAALLDAVTWTIALAGILLLLRYRVNASWVIAAAALAGLIVHGLR